MQGGLGALLFSKEDLRKLLVPLMLEQLLAVTIGMMDTMMVANCGEAAVSGISLVDSISVLFINMFSALNRRCSSSISISGTQGTRECQHSFEAVVLYDLAGVHVGYGHFPCNALSAAEYGFRSY